MLFTRSIQQQIRG